MNISDRGIAFIASFEGFSPVPYSDPAGNCTVGYGDLIHLGPCTDADMQRPPLTEDEGLAALRQKVQSYSDCVDSYGLGLNQAQHDALTSLTYNIGCGAFGHSSVRAAVTSGGDVRDALMQIVHGSDGVVYPGLVRRRAAEADLYYSQSQEDEEMKPFLAWCADYAGGSTWFVGPSGARWITDAAVVSELAKIFGPLNIALSSAALNAIGTK